MNPPAITKKTVLTITLVSALLGACSEEKAAAPVAAPPAPVEKPAPQIAEADKAAIDKDATSARACVDQARELKKKGLEMERATRGSGKETFNKAASLYSQAMGSTGKWCEPTAVGVNLTPEQREYYCAPLCRDRDAWLQEAASLVPLMQR